MTQETETQGEVREANLAGFKPFAVGRLDDARGCRIAASKIIRLAAKGKLPTADMVRFTRSIRTVFDMVIGAELEQRVAALEGGGHGDS